MNEAIKKEAEKRYPLISGDTRVAYLHNNYALQKRAGFEDGATFALQKQDEFAIGFAKWLINNTQPFGVSANKRYYKGYPDDVEAFIPVYKKEVGYE